MALTIPNRFVNGQTIDAARFNSNSDAITSWANGIDTSLSAVIGVASAGKGVFFAHSAAKQTVPGSSAITRLTLATEVVDADAWFTTNVFTPLQEGYYLLFGSIYSTGSAGFSPGTHALTLYIRKNDATPNHRATCSLNGVALSYTTIVSANGTTDYFDLAAFHTATDTFDCYYAQFGGLFIRPL